MTVVQTANKHFGESGRLASRPLLICERAEKNRKRFASVQAIFDISVLTTRDKFNAFVKELKENGFSGAAELSDKEPGPHSIRFDCKVNVTELPDCPEGNSENVSKWFWKIIGARNSPIK